MSADAPFRWLAKWRPPRKRDPLTVLEAAAEGRDEKAVSARTQAMTSGTVSDFFRGGAGVMAKDLGADLSRTTGLVVDVNGDAHLGNLGMYGSPERVRVFDLNDFDEARPGPWEWDVCRLAASAVVTERDLKAREDEQIATARSALAAYAETAARLAAGDLIDRWYSMTDCDRIDAADLGLGPRTKGANEERARAKKLLEAKNGDTQEDSVDKFVDAGEFVITGKIKSVSDKEAERVRGAFAGYAKSIAAGLQRLVRGYRPTAVASRESGLGSLGLRNYLLLIQTEQKDDALILQVKEATPSQLDFGLGPLAVKNEGKRVVDLQRSMQGASDPLLGRVRINGQAFYVRQFRDMKYSPDLIEDGLDHAQRTTFARLCGTALARAHARARQKTGIADISARIEADREAFAAAFVHFAQAYADVSRADQELYKAQVKPDASR